MKLSELKSILPSLEELRFVVQGGDDVPTHFHITEVGKVHRNFIDCGGTARKDYAVNLQLWHANDIDHRLEPGKLLKIITLSEEKLGITDGPVEVEYQGATIGRYGLSLEGNTFVLTATQTACLAQDACGVTEKPERSLSSLTATQCCTPNSGCC